MDPQNYTNTGTMDPEKCATPDNTQEQIQLYLKKCNDMVNIINQPGMIEAIQKDNKLMPIFMEAIQGHIQILRLMESMEHKTESS